MESDLTYKKNYVYIHTHTYIHLKVKFLFKSFCRIYDFIHEYLQCDIHVTPLCDVQTNDQKCYARRKFISGYNFYRTDLYCIN